MVSGDGIHSVNSNSSSVRIGLIAYFIDIDARAPSDHLDVALGVSSGNRRSVSRGGRREVDDRRLSKRFNQD